MTNEDFEKAFDDILANIDEQINKPSQPKISSMPKEPELSTNKAEEEDIKMPSPEVEDLIKPVLEEKTEPLVINFDEAVKKKNAPEFKVPEIVSADKREEPAKVEIPKINNETADILRFPKTEEDPTKKAKEMYDRVQKKSVGSIVIPKAAKQIARAKDLIEKKSYVIKKTLAIIAAGYIALAVIPNSAIKESYQNKIGVGFGEFVTMDIDHVVPETEPEDIGWNIADQIKTEMMEFNALHKDDGEKYDVNKAVMVYLGTAYDFIVDTAPFTKHGTIAKSYGAGERNDYWLESLYFLMQYQLRANGIIDLPESIVGYVNANGLNKGKMNYNPLTNRIVIDDTVGPVDFYDSLDNLKEYSRYLIGHGINPAKSIHQEFLKKVEIIQEKYPNNRVDFDEEGIKVYNDNGQAIYLATSTDPIVLVDISGRNINEEGVTNARS